MSFEEVLERRRSDIEQLARKVARGYGGGEADVDDMVSAGFEALWKTWQKYDETRGVSFWSYAYMRVIGAMVDVQRQRDHVPRSGRKTIQQGRQIPWAITRQVDDQLAAERAQSSDNQEERLGEAEFISKILVLTNRLPEPLRTILRDHHKRPLGELATKLKVSEARISQRYNEALIAVRKLLSYCDVCKTTLLETAFRCPSCGGVLWPAEPGDFPQIRLRRLRRTKTESPQR